MRVKLSECFDRHPGRYDVCHDTEKAGKKDGQIVPTRVAIHSGIHADDVIKIARREIAADPSATLTVFSATRGEQAHFATINSKNIHDLLEEVNDGPVEAAQTKAPAAAKELEEPPTPQADRGPNGEPAPEAPAKPARRPKAAKLPGDRFPVVRGKQLELDPGCAEPWPGNEATASVRRFFEEPDKKATAAEVIAAIGVAKFKEFGVEHPGSLISRLKQKGFLREVQS